MKIKNKSELERIRNSFIENRAESWIKVGYGTCGIAAGADEVYTSLTEELKKRKLDIPVYKCGCAGMCYAEPLVEIQIKDMPSVFYGRVTKEVVRRIIEEHIGRQRLLDDYIYDLAIQTEE